MERRRNFLISKLKSWYWYRTHKYGINIPKSVSEAYSFNKKNSNKLCLEGTKEKIIR